MSLSSTSSLIMELGGTASGSGYDQLQSSGTLTFDGTLLVSLINGFTPSAGQSFNLFDWISAGGTFDTLQLPTLAGLAWNTSQLYTNGILSLAAAGLAGDYNDDGIVDAVDYAVWRNNLNDPDEADLNHNGDGGEVTASDYTWWKQHYGDSLPPGGGGIAAESLNASPEPATAVLVLIAATFGPGCNRLGPNGPLFR